MENNIIACICTWSNILAAPAYGVYISQMIQYSRACGSYQDFLDRGLLLTRKLLNQVFLLVKLKSSLRKFCGRHHDLVNRYGISVSQMTTDNVPLVVSTSRSFPNSRLITGFVTRLTWRVPLVEQELFTLPEHLSSHLVFNGVRVTRSLVLYVCFFRSLFVLCTFSFGHCVVCSLIYRFSLPPFGIIKLFLNSTLYNIYFSCFF